tara:strand:+ start:735 stop:1556 length:822 start_codon:yes stop_codon:yes gene_type:complete
MGQWKRYRCIAQSITGEQTSGSTLAVDFPKLRATGDANEGATYTIVMTGNSGTDHFHYIKNEGKGNEETVYAGVGTTDKFVHVVNGTDLAGNLVYASIDEGVEIAIPNNTYTTGDKFKFTIPKLEKVYDGGIHGFCQMAFAIGSTLYTDPIPYKISEVATFAINSRFVRYTVNSSDTTGNSGTSTDLQYTVDGTNYTDGFELINDTNMGDAVAPLDSENCTAIFDKSDATGTAPKETGGQAVKYRLKFSYENLGGGEKILGRKQFLHVAIYNH